ncbi:DUF1801 domain-containing protein [soil metagenome]
MTTKEQIDTYITNLPDWRGDRLAKLRQLIHQADPDIIEEWKWEIPVFTHQGMICAIASFNDHVKINFFQGASLLDPKGLFNAGLEAKRTRAIDLFEGDTIEETSLKELIRTAVSSNTAKK